MTITRGGLGRFKWSTWNLVIVQATHWPPKKHKFAFTMEVVMLTFDFMMCYLSLQLQNTPTSTTTKHIVSGWMWIQSCQTWQWTMIQLRNIYSLDRVEVESLDEFREKNVVVIITLLWIKLEHMSLVDTNVWHFMLDI